MEIDGYLNQIKPKLFRKDYWKNKPSWAESVGKELAGIISKTQYFSAQPGSNGRSFQEIKILSQEKDVAQLTISPEEDPNLTVDFNGAAETQEFRFSDLGHDPRPLISSLLIGLQNEIKVAKNGEQIVV